MKSIHSRWIVLAAIYLWAVGTATGSPQPVPCSASVAGDSPLVRATLDKDETSVLRLIEKGADLAQCVTEREVRQLAEPNKHIRYVGGPPESGYPLIVLLAVANMPKAVAALAERTPAQIHALDPHGNSTLAWASRLFHTGVVDQLLGMGLDPLQASEEKETPLSLIMRSREKSAAKTETVRLLIGKVPRDRFFAIGVVDQVWTAAYMGDFDTLKVLLEAGVPPHYVAPQGRTALYSAVEASNLDAVRLLLDHGARVSSYPYRGQTIFQVAEDNFYRDKPDAQEINRLIQLEREKLVKLGHNPPGTSPQDWNSRSDIEYMQFMKDFKW